MTHRAVAVHPEPGTSTGGGATSARRLPGDSDRQGWGDTTRSIACLAGLGPGPSADGGRRCGPDQVAVEFFVQHGPACPLRCRGYSQVACCCVPAARPKARVCRLRTAGRTVIVAVLLHAGSETVVMEISDELRDERALDATARATQDARAWSGSQFASPRPKNRCRRIGRGRGRESSCAVTPVS
jgi:hypothetical protein